MVNFIARGGITAIQPFGWVLCAVLVVVGCGDESADPDRPDNMFPRVSNILDALSSAGLGDYLNTVEPVSEARLSPASQWTRQEFDPASGAVCANGSPFFSAYREGSENNLMVLLDSGGACWNDLTCAIGTAASDPSPPGREGLLSAWTEAVTADWHTLFVPYCDASVFVGDNVVQFPRAGERVFHGLRNLSAALGVAASKMPDPDQVLVVGQSAGGYGAIFATGPTRLTYPTAEMLLFADSGTGVTNPENELQLADFRANWRFTDRLPCASCDPQYIRFVGWMLQNDSRFRRAGIFSFTGDETMRQFLGTIGLFSFTPLSRAEFGSMVRSEFQRLEEHFVGRFEYFLAPGDAHIVSDDDDLFTQTAVDGITALDWFNGLVRRNGDFRSVDHGRQ
ncbi:MAG: pectin acetylesterase-family hydrolase [Myxococcota bacterium]